ncbi:MAG: carboxymuconolactone decarboxylase family protein [Thermoanaerobaculia bacterium]
MAHVAYVFAPEYEADVAGKRGRVANILKVHGIEPDVGRAHLALYMAIQFGPSTVTRLEREAIAVAVSAANGCHY